MSTWKKIALWKKILIGVVIGLIIGFVSPAAAEFISPLGDIFLRMLKMLIVPLVFFSITSGICKMGDVKQLRTVGVRYVLWIVVSAVIAATCGVIAGLIVQPGKGTTEFLAAAEAAEAQSYSFIDNVIGWFPTNIVESMANANMLHITAATITSGEKTDGKELPKLVQKSKAAGIQIESVIGDMAYSEKKNIEAAKEGDYELIAKLNPIITQGNRRKEDEFEFNKDAGMYQCKAGHLAIHKYFDKRKKDKKNKNPRKDYFFDIDKCKCCSYRGGCYKEGAKKKTYTETIICDSHSEQVKFQETEHFKEKMRERYKIEAKNSELKHRHGYDVASSSGLICMEMQGAMMIFAVNLKRIIKLMNEK